MVDRNVLEHTLRRMSAGQQSRANQLLDALEGGHITVTEFIETISTSVLSANVRAYALGAAVARGLIERQTGQVELTPVTGSGAHRDEARVAGAIATILASDHDTRMQILRLAGNEPQQSAVAGSQDVIAGSGPVIGYRRVLETGACELCRWLERDGFIWPKDKAMHRHPGCVCQQQPVTAFEE